MEVRNSNNEIKVFWSLTPLGKSELSVMDFKDIPSLLLKDIIARTYYSATTGAPNSTGSLVELKRFSARPPGCSFLGSKATQVPVNINLIHGDC